MVFTHILPHNSFIQEKEASTIQYASLACHFLAEAVKVGLENEDIVSTYFRILM